MPAWEDLSAFLDTDDFAVTATFIHIQTGQFFYGVPGIFDDPTANAEAGGFDLAGTSPTFLCAADRVAALKKYDVAIIGGVNYRLDHDPHPDGTGMARLNLSVDYPGSTTETGS
jgi:hypothetical protein